MSINAGFHRLKIAEVRRETADAVSIQFEIPESLRNAFLFKAGQHLTLRTEIDGEDTRRNYSVCASPFDGEIRIAIKQMPGGRFSSWANRELKRGDSIDVLPPLGRFGLPEDFTAAPHYLALAGGSGITPVISIIKTALKQVPDCTFTLLYGNRDSASIMFLEELLALKNRHMGRFEIYHFLENEAEEIELFNGRLDRAKCDEVLSALVDVTSIDGFYICGPGPMMDAAEEALLARGVSPGGIMVERFTTGALSAEQLANNEALQQKAAGAALSIVLDGRRSSIRFDAAKGSILDSVQAAGLPAPYACKGGVCTTCRAKVLAGTVTMKKNYGLTDQETAQGYILTCQAVPTSDSVSISYDA
jgi:ring-1,2-phenylacetyl-CoA epoxidase subunit PaaE